MRMHRIGYQRRYVGRSAPGNIARRARVIAHHRPQQYRGPFPADVVERNRAQHRENEIMVVEMIALDTKWQ